MVWYRYHDKGVSPILTEREPAKQQAGAQRKLLIVDDEEKVCHLLEQFFAHKGYTVRAVCGGDEAVALAEIFCPHVVLLDLQMPGMDGVQTLKRLKTLRPTPKVLMLSAVNHTEVITGALSLGADFYICKPVNLSELERLVNLFSPPILP